MKLPMTDARNSLPSLLDRVAKGEHFEITRHGEVVAELRPPRRLATTKRTVRGAIIAIAEDFDAPMDQAWEALR